LAWKTVATGSPFPWFDSLLGEEHIFLFSFVVDSSPPPPQKHRVPVTFCGVIFRTLPHGNSFHFDIHFFSTPPSQERRRPFQTRLAGPSPVGLPPLSRSLVGVIGLFLVKVVGTSPLFPSSRECLFFPVDLLRFSFSPPF